MAARELTSPNFGLFISYVLPGFTALQGLPFLSGSTVQWGTQGVCANATLTDFLSGTVEAVAAGLTVSTIRWLLIDTVHHYSGLKPPRWDFATLDKGVDGFGLLILIHYQYYKFYANMVVALELSYAMQGSALGWRGVWYWVLAVLFFIASRDALKKYYERSGRLLAAGP